MVLNQDLTLLGYSRPESASSDAATAYGVTLHTHQREPLFGSVVEGVIQLNSLGQIVAQEWVTISRSHREIELDAWIVRPNCVQGILWVPATPSSVSSAALAVFPESPKPRQLSAFVAGFKAAAAKRINLVRNQPGFAVWQRNYTEALLPNAAALNRMRQLIHTYSKPKA
ncbi:MAG TPA: hypothetical protein V6D29_10310 [Leptolyngbyaceae cyanobacterium]